MGRERRYAYHRQHEHFVARWFNATFALLKRDCGGWFVSLTAKRNERRKRPPCQFTRGLGEYTETGAESSDIRRSCFCVRTPAGSNELAEGSTTLIGPSGGSEAALGFLLFPTTWGICFSFKTNSNGLNVTHKSTVRPRWGAGFSLPGSSPL